MAMSLSHGPGSRGESSRWSAGTAGCRAAPQAPARSSLWWRSPGPRVQWVCLGAPVSHVHLNQLEDLTGLFLLTWRKAAGHDHGSLDGPRCSRPACWRWTPSVGRGPVCVGVEVLGGPVLNICLRGWLAGAEGGEHVAMGITLRACRCSRTKHRCQGPQTGGQSGAHMSQPVERCGPHPTGPNAARGEAWDSDLPTSPQSAHFSPCPPPPSPLSAHLPHSYLPTFLTPVFATSPQVHPSSPICKPQSMSALLLPICPPHPCPPAPTRLPASVHVRPPHPSAHLTHLPTSPVRPLPTPLAHPPMVRPPHSWSKCLMRLRRPTFPGGSAQEVPTLVQRPRAGASTVWECEVLSQPTGHCIPTHMAAQAGGRPCMRVGKGEGAVASAGSSGKGSPSRTQKAPDTNRARQRNTTSLGRHCRIPLPSKDTRIPRHQRQGMPRSLPTLHSALSLYSQGLLAVVPIPAWPSPTPGARSHLLAAPGMDLSQALGAHVSFHPDQAGSWVLQDAAHTPPTTRPCPARLS